MTTYSKDYHDYVFREGKLVAEFENMYRYSDGTPWNQDKQENWMDVRLTAEFMKDVGPYAEIHDLGCGLGHYLALMCVRLGTQGCRGFGYDISESACIKAGQLFPQYRFKQMDLTVEVENPRSYVTDQPPQPVRRLFMIRGTLWYVFPRLSTVVSMICNLMSSTDQLMVIQNFPPLDQPFIGKDVLPNHQAVLRYFGECFVPVRHLWFEDTLKAKNDNWFMGLFSVRNGK
jgi:SAM-dependent methyltransferase